MNVIIFGVVGYKEIRMPLEELEVDELEEGREFFLKGAIYEIRSINETERGILINVILVSS